MASATLITGIGNDLEFKSDGKDKIATGFRKFSRVLIVLFVHMMFVDQMMREAAPPPNALTFKKNH